MPISAEQIERLSKLITVQKDERVQVIGPPAAFDSWRFRGFMPNSLTTNTSSLSAYLVDYEEDYEEQKLLHEEERVAEDRLKPKRKIEV